MSEVGGSLRPEGPFDDLVVETHGERVARVGAVLDSYLTYETPDARDDAITRIMGRLPVLPALSDLAEALSRPVRLTDHDADVLSRVSLGVTGLAVPPASVADAVRDEVTTIVAMFEPGPPTSERVAGQHAAVDHLQRMCDNVTAPKTRPRPVELGDPGPAPLAHLDVAESRLAEAERDLTTKWAPGLGALAQPRPVSPGLPAPIYRFVGKQILESIPELTLDWPGLRARLDSRRAQIAATWPVLAQRDGIGLLEARWRVEVADGLRSLAGALTTSRATGAGHAAYALGYDGTQAWATRKLRDRAYGIARPGSPRP